MIQSQYDNRLLKLRHSFILTSFVWVTIPVFIALSFVMEWSLSIVVLSVFVAVMVPTFWWIRRIWDELYHQNRMLKVYDEEKAQWEEVWNYAPCTLTEVSRDGVIMKANRTFWGEGLGDVTGTYFSEHLQEADKAVFENLLREAEESKRSQECEVHVVNDEGKGKSLSLVVVPVLEKEMSHRFVVMGMDMTSRRQTEESLMQSLNIIEEGERKVVAAFNDSQDPLLIVDQGYVLECNSVAKSLLHHGEESNVIGANLGDIIQPADSIEMQHHLSMVAKNGVHRFSATHQKTPLEITMTSIMFQSREATHVLLKDMSDYFMAKKETDQAHKKIEALNKAKSEFLGRLVYEVRAPMRLLVGLTDKMSHSNISEEQRNLCNMAQNSAHALMTIMEDMLDFSQLDEEKVRIEGRAFDVGAMLSEVLDVHALRAQAKGVEIIGDYSPSLPRRVVGDAKRLRQVINHLLSNAVKFTDSGFVLLKVEQESVVDGRSRLRISVRDTGEGLPADKQRFMLEGEDPTGEIGSSTAAVGSGVARRVIEMMGGSLRVESEVGKGATFIINIDLEVDLEAPVGRLKADLSGANVMLVCECQEGLRVMSEELDRYGVSFSSSVTPLGALEKLKQAASEGSSYNLLVVDQSLSGMEMDRFVQEVRAEPALKSVGIVVLTTMKSVSDYIHPEEKGCSAFAVKPLHASQLVQVLEATWHKRIGLPNRSATAEEKSKSKSDISILLAEDIKSNQMVAKMVLNSLGYQNIHSVWDGTEAVAYMKENDVDIVLMDVQMPKMDGFEAAREIGRLQKDRKVSDARVIALTPNGSAEEKGRCAEAGMEDVLLKPLKAEDVRAVLDARLKDKLR